ncbi:subtilisin-like protease [Dorcoceras hygrometricum]|uniref:Subtilisin-like protease n=1 Tax=Dorcoceras hygrometricum TaxID=472368 RepID=A0A2Z7CH49_9LAMI|nr:subtilisin-like protease [Dorcoceras hygrometricum]
MGSDEKEQKEQRVDETDIGNDFDQWRQVPESVVDTEFVPHGIFIEPVRYWGVAPSLIKTWGWARVCTEVVRYSMFGCLRPGVYTDSFVGYFSDSDVQSIQEFDSTSSDGSTVYRSPSPQVESFEEAESIEPSAHLALGPALSGVAQEEQSYLLRVQNLPLLHFKVAAIRSEQLEIQAKIAADILILSTQLGDLVDYIRGGDAKKGEGSSSRRPLPPPVNQGEGSGNRTSGDTVRTTEIAQRDIDNAQRDILERFMAADRQRERERDMVTVKFNRNNTIRSTAKVAVNRDVHIRVTRDHDVTIRYRYSMRNSYCYSVFNG